MRKLLKTLLLAVCLLGGENYAGAQTTSVGTDNTTGWWTAFSDYYTIGQNHTLKVSFKNYSSKAENWFNYIGVITTDANRNAVGYSEYVVMRADCYGWQGDLNTNNSTAWFTSNTNNYDWDTFKDDMDGASVVMTIKRQGAKVTMRFDVTTAAETPANYYHEFVINCGDGTQNIRAFLTTQNGHLTDISSSDLDNEALNYNSTYTVPEGWAIKNTFIGTQNNDGTSVSPETFKNVTTLPSAWDNGEVNSIGIVWKDKVATAAISASQSGTPTYVGGYTMRAYLRTGGDGSSIKYASYNLSSPVSKGKLFFATDVFADGDNTTTGPVYIRLVDSDGNPVLTLRPSTYDSSQRAYGYIIGSESLTSLGGNTVWRTYQGYGIKDLIVDFETGNVELKLDLINRQKLNNVTDWYHMILPFTDIINIGTGKNIAKVQIGKGSISKNDLYFYMDNVQLFSMEQQYSYTINYKVGNTTVKTVTAKAFEDDVINVESSFEIDDITYVPTQEATTSLTISSTEEDNVLDVPVVASVPYTISYKYNGTEIKSEAGNAETGTQVTATYTTSLWNDAGDTKYYVADNAETTFDIGASNNDFIVDLRLAAIDAVATVNAVCGNTTHKTFTSTAGIEGEEVTVYYSIVVQSDEDDKYYTVSTTNYSESLTYGASTNVAYTLDESIVGFTEIGTGSNATQSGGGNTALNSKFAEATVDAGLYRAEIMVISKAGSGSNHRNEGVYVANTKVASLTGNINGLRTLDFVVPSDGTNVYVRGIGTNNYADNLDYVIIRKTDELPDISATLDNKGFATFACGYPLDLTADGLPTGLTAYKAAISGTRVIFTELDQTVPANTGVLLRGTANESYDIPLVASGTTVTENAFLVNTTGSTFEADMNFNYFAMKKNNYPLIFALFDPSVLAIPATKAFLKIAKESGSRLTCVFANDDETITGVQTVTQEGQPKGQAYNLQGQRVEQLRSGCLYIVDGKKIIMK